MSMFANLQAWVATHRAAAAGTAAVAGVGGVALYRRHAAKTPASSSPDAGAAADGTATGTPSSSSPDVAGLTSDGSYGDYTSEIENWVQDALNTQTQQLQAQLNQPKPPVAPKPSGPTAPKAGAGLYTIRKGDTLTKIAMAVFGRAGPRDVGALRFANPILGGWPNNAKLDWLAGRTIRIPKPPRKPPVKPPKSAAQAARQAVGTKPGLQG